MKKFGGALRAVKRIGAPAGPVLTQALKDPNPKVRRKAAYALDDISDALAEIGDLRAADALIVALSDELQPTQEHAAKALGKLGVSKAVEPLITLLREHANHRPYLRGAVTFGLRRIGQPAVASLIRVLEDSDPYVRKKAAVLLGRIADTQAVAPLITALKDSQRSVRISAALALGQLGDVEAIPPLTELLNDEAATVRLNTVVALTKFGTCTIKPLTRMLEDSDHRVRKQVLTDAVGELKLGG